MKPTTSRTLAGRRPARKPFSSHFLHALLTRWWAFAAVVACLSAVAPNAHADVRSGSFSAKATLSGASYTQIYAVAKVSKNTNYVASLWVLGSGKLNLIVNNPAWTYFPANIQVTASGTWTQYSLPFNSGANTQMIIRLYDEFGSGSGSVMYIDDAFIGLSGGSNLLTNPSFEGGTTGWNVGSAFTIGQFAAANALLANGTYTIAPATAPNKLLDVAAQGTGNGTNVQLWSPLNATSQRWIFTRLSGNTYRISPAHASAQCLDVSGQATASGTNVQIWQYLSQANQQWSVTADNGGYTLTPQHAVGLRLNSTGTADGSNVNVITDNGSSSQKWIFAAVTAGSAPAAPTGLSAAAGNGQVSLSWSPSSGAVSYNLYRATTSNGEGGSPFATGLNSTNYTDTGRTNGVTYYYKVAAVNSVGISVQSNEASATPNAQGTETIGGGSTASPAIGPPPSFSSTVGAGYTLVKNWNFGSNGTIKSRAELNQEFQYTDQFFVGAGGGGKYGSLFVASDAAHVMWQGQRYDGGPGTPNTRDFLTDTLRTYLVPLDGASIVQASNQNVGCGSIVAKWTLPNGGALLGKDLLWEVRVRYVTPPYFWFAIWTSGNRWNNGAEMDVQESFGFDNGGGNTNFDGRYWHVNSVGGNDTLVPNFINNWPSGMASRGITSFDATQFHVWQWLYQKDNSYSAYVDGILVQSGSLIWTDGATSGGTPINMYFELDGAWGHTAISSVNKPLAASQLQGKYYDWDYSRVYLKN